MTENPSPKHFLPSWIKHWLLIAGAFLIPLVLFLGFVVSLDLFRNLNDPSEMAQDWMQVDVRKALAALEEGDGDSGSVSGTESKPKEQTGAPSRLSETALAIRPFPDLSLVPEGKKKSAKEWNKKNDELTARLLRLLDDLEKMDEKSALERYKKIVKDFHGVYSRIRESEKFSVSDPGGSVQFDESWNWGESINARDELIWRVHLSILIHHEDWSALAERYRGLGMGGETEYWDWEVYYRRKNGLRGYGNIALRSLERIAVKTGIRKRPRIGHVGR